MTTFLLYSYIIIAAIILTVALLGAVLSTAAGQPNADAFSWIVLAAAWPLVAPVALAYMVAVRTAARRKERRQREITRRAIERVNAIFADA